MPRAERVKLRDKIYVLDPKLEGKPEVKKDFDKVMEWLQECEDSPTETLYRTTAEEDYKFYAGNQDTAEVRALLESMRRPNSTFNEIKPKIDMLIGLAAQVKYDGYVIPVGAEDEPLAELTNGTLLHFRRKLKLGRKELDCFEHMVKSGRSLLYYRIDNSNPYKPRVIPVRVPGYNFAIDPSSVEYDLSDATYLFVWSWVDEEELKGIDPDIDPAFLSTETNTGFGAPIFFDQLSGKYRIITCWYKKWELKYWIINPFTGESEALSKEEYREFNKVAMAGIADPKTGEELKITEPLSYIRGYAVEYRYMTFSGDYLIAADKSPHRKEVEFPATLYGAYKDDDNNRWFGAVTVQKDPQRAVNVMRRQLVHLLQTLPKGILMHENGAILDIEGYEQNSANPNYHMEIADGKIDKVKFQQQPSISPVYQMLDDIMRNSMKDSSGIRDDLMGAYTASREPGVTVSLRKESNIAVLFIVFNNYRESRLLGNKKLLYLLQQYTTDKEVIRIQGEMGAQLMEINSQLNPQVGGWNDFTAGEFDLEMEETVETGSFRTAIAEMLVEFSHNNPGTIPPDVIMDYMSLPFTVKKKIKEYWQAQQEQEQENIDADRAVELMKIQAGKEVKAAKPKTSKEK